MNTSADKWKDGRRRWGVESVEACPGGTPIDRGFGKIMGRVV